MSAITPNVPFVAPWRAEFQRYATVPMPLDIDVSAAFASLVVPGGQWWRIVSLFAEATMSNTAADRVIEVDVTDTSNNTVVTVAIPTALKASDVALAWWAPNTTSTATTVNGTVLGTAGLPDVLWQFGYTIRVGLVGNTPGDAIGTATALVEMYTEFSNSQGQAVLAPTPIIP